MTSNHECFAACDLRGTGNHSQFSVISMGPLTFSNFASVRGGVAAPGPPRAPRDAPPLFKLWPNASPMRGVQAVESSWPCGVYVQCVLGHHGMGFVEFIQAQCEAPWPPKASRPPARIGGRAGPPLRLLRVLCVGRRAPPALSKPPEFAKASPMESLQRRSVIALPNSAK